MCARTLLLMALGIAATTGVRGQIVPPGQSGPAGSPGPTLAQFQPGISPLGSNIELTPGRQVRLAMYCADLFANTPTHQVAFVAPAGDATVTLESGFELTLGEALESRLLLARGSGPGDPPHQPGGQWFDVHLTNVSCQPLRVSMPAGTLLVPSGQAVPDVRPSVRRLFTAARQRGLLGSETLARAVWATRGFDREDVEQTTMAPLSNEASRQVQELLAAADLGFQFDRGRGEYTKLFEERRTAMDGVLPVTGSALLPSGKRVQAEVVAGKDGDALVALEPGKAGGTLLYAGRVTERKTDRLVVELRHLKTGRALDVARTPLLVKLGAQVARRD